MNLHRLAEERSLAYHAAIAAELARDPAVLEAARRRVAGWIAAGTPHPHYALAWAAILDSPVSEVCRLLLDPGATARALRQVTPFAGMVPPRARWRLWREVRARHETTE